MAMVAIVKWFFFMEALFRLNTCSFPVFLWDEREDGTAASSLSPLV